MFNLKVSSPTRCFSCSSLLSLFSASSLVFFPSSVFLSSVFLFLPLFFSKLSAIQLAPQECLSKLSKTHSLQLLTWKSISLSKENSLKLFQNLSHFLLSLQPKRALSSPSPQKTLCQQARNSPLSLQRPAPSKTLLPSSRKSPLKSTFPPLPQSTPCRPGISPLKKISNSQERAQAAGHPAPLTVCSFLQIIWTRVDLWLAIKNTTLVPQQPTMHGHVAP